MTTPYVDSLEGQATKYNVRQWTFTASDTGQALSMPTFGDRTIQLAGTFGGGTCIIQGSIDGVNWETLTDPLGNLLSFTSNDIATITEATRFIRPILSGASGPNLLVTLLSRI
jgi:hypothetical protein